MDPLLNTFRFARRVLVAAHKLKIFTPVGNFTSWWLVLFLRSLRSESALFLE